MYLFPHWKLPIYPTRMLENSSEDLSQDVYKYLTGKRLENKCLLVKRHTENLQKQGDYSFPNLVHSWHGHVALPCKNPSDSLLECICLKAEDLMTTSKEWSLPIAKTAELKDRIHLYLDRTVATKVGLNQGLRNNALLIRKLNEFVTQIHSDPQSEDTNDLTSLRLKCLSRCIENLHKLVNRSDQKIFVTSKSSSKCPEDSRLVLCGTVLNAKTGVKECAISADEYIRIRQNEMLLVAQHKYGVRVSTDSKWKEFIDHLGESAVVFELLQIKPSSAVKINFECSSSGSSRGASFILYNCARLETIIRTYNERVADGIYPPLPELEDTDFSLLTQEDEWTLMFNFILGLPSLLHKCMELNDKSCEIRPHQLCGALSGMVRVFSHYYTRVRILTEARKHLLPVIFARMHMLIVLNETLKICLKVLNIKSVSQM